MPGPAPKLNAIRRNARVGPVKLPVEGRKGDPPKWPEGTFSVAEQRVWREVWAFPQAVMWERMALLRVVARYCRLTVRVNGGLTAQAPVMAELRQIEDRLGLSPKALRALMWEIVPDEVKERRQENLDAEPAESARNRIKAV